MGPVGGTDEETVYQVGAGCPLFYHWQRQIHLSTGVYKLHSVCMFHLLVVQLLVTFLRVRPLIGKPNSWSLVCVWDDFVWYSRHMPIVLALLPLSALLLVTNTLIRCCCTLMYVHRCPRPLRVWY